MKKYKTISNEVIQMAKAIAPTPTLKGKDTKSFLKEMKRPNNKKENQIRDRINNSRHVDFF